MVASPLAMGRLYPQQKSGAREKLMVGENSNDSVSGAAVSPVVFFTADAVSVLVVSFRINVDYSESFFTVNTVVVSLEVVLAFFSHSGHSNGEGDGL